VSSRPLRWRLFVAPATGLGIFTLAAAMLFAPTAPDTRPVTTGDIGQRATPGTPQPSVEVEAVPARRTGALPAEPPVSVRLPDGVRVPVRAASTRSDGVLDVPRNVEAAGWWRGGSQIGDPLGATLLAAHVDSTTQGLGPFAALLRVRPGQQFVVSSATLHQAFQATSLRLVPQGALLDDASMFGPGGPRRLVLVTCAPPYVAARGGYQNLAVVTALPVSSPTSEDR